MEQWNADQQTSGDSRSADREEAGRGAGTTFVSTCIERGRQREGSALLQNSDGIVVQSGLVAGRRSWFRSATAVGDPARCSCGQSSYVLFPEPHGSVSIGQTKVSVR